MQIDENKNKPEDVLDTSVILKTALKTFVMSIAAIVLVAALLVTVLPYESMRVYMQLGMKARALECAENYIGTQRSKYETSSPSLDSRFVSALYVGCELSMSLFDSADFESSERTQRAEEVKKYTEEYLSVSGIDMRNTEIGTSSVSRQPYWYYHVSLYNYRDTLVRHNYLARCALGEDERSFMLVRGYDTTQVSVDRIAAALGNMDFTLRKENGDVDSGEMVKYAEVFNMLSAMVLHEYRTLGVEDPDSLQGEEGAGRITLPSGRAWFAPLVTRTTQDNKTELLRQLENKFETFKECALDMPAGNKWEMLEKMYVFRSLAYFSDRMFLAMRTLASSEMYSGIGSTEWAFWLNQTVGGEKYSMSTYYRDVLEKQYVKMLAAAA